MSEDDSNFSLFFFGYFFLVCQEFRLLNSEEKEEIRSENQGISIIKTHILLSDESMLLF